MTASARTPLAASLAADPFSSLAVHYGMLLGVSDFQVLMANPRGKLRLHQAWLHGPGVVWGYPVSVKPDSAELVVGPGLAVDGLGREVALSGDYCLDVAAWLAARQEEVDPVTEGDSQIFNAQLVLRHRACLASPVPAMSTTCSGGESETAFSRVLETAELELRPYGNDENGSPDPPADTRGEEFAALRALVRAGDTGTPPVPGDWLQAFRSIAAAVTAGLAPPAIPGGVPASSHLFPVDEPGEVLLADLPGLRVVATAAGPRLEAPVIDLSVRRAHVPTWVVEELLAELLIGHAGPGPAPDAGGPRVLAIERTDQHVTITLTGPVVEGAIADAFELRSFDASAADPAWSAPIDVSATRTFAAGPPPTITFDLPAAPTADVSYRLLLRGTGPAPLAGLVANRPVPLAGRAGGPAGSAAQGHDVAVMFTEQGALS